MTVRDIQEKLGLSVACGEEKLDQPVTGGYVGDLLSDVIAHSGQGNVWVTMQVHMNIVAVAVLKELTAIIIVNGRVPAEDTLQKAVEEKIPILLSRQTGFEVSGELYVLGVGRVT